MTSTREEVRERRELNSRLMVQRLRQEGFPRSSAMRWLLRLAFASPYLAIALFVNLSGSTIAGTPNASLAERAASISWDSLDIVWLEQLYPPVTTIVAALLPGGRLGLALLGAAVAGGLLLRLLEIMVQRSYPRGTMVFLLVAFAANPLFVYTATENFEGIVCLGLFGVGLADTVRFFAWNDTQAGFRAGLLFMLTVLASPAGFFYVAVAVLAAPFLRLARREQAGARAANVLILAFPTIASLLAFAFLEWAFVGRPFSFVPALVADGRPFADVMTILFTTFNGFLVMAPVLSAWLVALIVRKPGAILVSTLVFFGVVANSVLGFLPVNSAGDTFLLMVVMAIVLIPTAKSISSIVLVDVIAVLQIIIAWTAAFNRAVVLEWMHAIGLA
jgi:hypothetical protein